MASSSSSASSVKYPYPVEVNVRDFVSVILSQQNYLVWRELMLRLFESRGLVGFINGEVVAPPEKITIPNDDVNSANATKEMMNQNYQDWKRSDALSQRWIIGTIGTEDFLPHVVCLKTAKDMWSKLFTLHEKKKDYPYPIEIRVGDFVSVKLSRENTFVWEKLMRSLLKSRGLLGFINGKVGAPPKMIKIADENSNRKKEIENPDYKAWKRIDELLQSWIMGTIDQKDVLSSLVDLETAQQIMTKLEKVFNFEFVYGSTDAKIEEATVEDIQFSEYLALHKAALTGDWETAKEFIKQKPDAVRAFITRVKETALMVAVRSSSARGNHFVKKLLELMSPDDVALRDDTDLTALHYAAIAGNTVAAKFLVDKNPELPNYCSYRGLSPLRKAARHGRRKMVVYLLEVTKEDIHPKQFEGRNGSALVKQLLLSGLFDIALLLIQRYPKLAWKQKLRALRIISLKCSSAFKSGTHLNWWQSLIYSYFPTKLEAPYHYCGGDIENPTNISLLSVKQKLHYVIWKATLKFVPQMKYIRDIKLKHEQALELVKHLCSKSLELNYSKAKEIIQVPLMCAVNSGIPEIVEEIIEKFPNLVYHTNGMEQNIFHVAILNRCEAVFNLIYQFREEVRHLILTYKDSNGKSCLDLVVDLKKEQKLNLRASAAGAAFQMQRELQWFKEVEKHTITFYKGRKKEMSTLGPVYTETHEELVKEGEKWMKDTATSCTIIAALVVTVVFAAAITIPGGNDDKNGIPILLQDNAFMIFVTSDALALFSSISSVVMFLSILTSRYSVTDFLFTLPNRLIIGLVTLFISLISMMVAFGATLYLIFEGKIIWILFPVIVFSCIPVVLFAYSQFPHLLDMIMSTYGPGIFRQQSDRILF